MKASGHTAYATAAQACAKLLAIASDESVASDPEVVANAIAKAIRAKRPKARYPVGTGAEFLVTFRKFASDAMMDALMQLMIRRGSAREP
jgi:hypothetical protein